MIFYDEIYYEITLKGLKSNLKRVIDFLLNDGLEDFFEFDEEMIIYGDSYNQATDSMVTDITIVSDDGIQTDAFDVDEFLEIFCRVAKQLDVYGFIYDADEVEYSFISEAGNDFYKNSRDFGKFNDELDSIRDDEETNAAE